MKENRQSEYKGVHCMECRWFFDVFPKSGKAEWATDITGARVFGLGPLPPHGNCKLLPTAVEKHPNDFCGMGVAR